jgi:hypothetical protein
MLSINALSIRISDSTVVVVVSPTAVVDGEPVVVDDSDVAEASAPGVIVVVASATVDVVSGGACVVSDAPKTDGPSPLHAAASTASAANVDTCRADGRARGRQPTTGVANDEPGRKARTPDLPRTSLDHLIEA